MPLKLLFVLMVILVTVCKAESNNEVFLEPLEILCTEGDEVDLPCEADGGTVTWYDSDGNQITNGGSDRFRISTSNQLMIRACLESDNNALYTCEANSGVEYRYSLSVREGCPVLSVANAMVDYAPRGRMVGYTGRITCNTNYVLIGDEVVICQDDHTWSPDVPYCKYYVTYHDEDKQDTEILINEVKVESDTGLRELNTLILALQNMDVELSRETAEIFRALNSSEENVDAAIQEIYRVLTAIQEENQDIRGLVETNSQTANQVIELFSRINNQEDATAQLNETVSQIMEWMENGGLPEVPGIISEADEAVLSQISLTLQDMLFQISKEESAYAFHACANNTIGYEDYTTGNQVMFGNVLVNSGGWYDPISSIFTSHQSGLYQFYVTVINSPYYPVRFAIMKNGEPKAEVFVNVGSMGQSTQASNAIIMECNAGDIISVGVLDSNAGQRLAVSGDADTCLSSFSGYLIIPTDTEVTREMETFEEHFRQHVYNEENHALQLVVDTITVLSHELSSLMEHKKVALFASLESTNPIQLGTGDQISFNNIAWNYMDSYVDGVYTVPLTGLYSIHLSTANMLGHSSTGKVTVTRHGQTETYIVSYINEPTTQLMHSNQINLLLHSGDKVSVSTIGFSGITFGTEGYNAVSSLNIQLISPNYVLPRPEPEVTYCYQTNDDRICMDSFYYSNVWYSSCTNGFTACATTVDLEDNGMAFGLCDHTQPMVECTRLDGPKNCYVTAENNVCLNHTYIYSGAPFDSCESTWWCATEVNEWGEMISYGTCTSDRVVCPNQDQNSMIRSFTQADPIVATVENRYSYNTTWVTGQYPSNSENIQIIDGPSIEFCKISCLSDCLGVTYRNSQCTLYFHQDNWDDLSWEDDLYSETLWKTDSPSGEDLRHVMSLLDNLTAADVNSLSAIIDNLNRVNNGIMDDIQRRSVAFSACTSTWNLYYSPGELITFGEVITNNGDSYRDGVFYVPYDGLYLFESTLTNEINYPLKARIQVNGAYQSGVAIVEDIEHRDQTTLRVIMACNAGDRVNIATDSDGNFPMAVADNYYYCVSNFNGRFLAPLPEPSGN